MKHKLTLSIYTTITVILVMLTVLNDCGSKKSESAVVAMIEDRLISADEFAFAYELAPSQLTKLETREARLAVLERLTDRVLLAREAESRELARSDSTLQRALDLYKRQAVNRELYRKYIRRPISVSEDEERTAFSRSKITYYIRHHESETTENAAEVSRGDAPFRHKPLFAGVETVQLESFGYVDRIPWREIPANIEELIANLPVGQKSEPFFYMGKHHILQVVDTEREVLLRENDFQANRESLHGIIRKRKEAVAASAFVQDMMAPQQLVIKADALNNLTNWLWNRRPASIGPEAQYISDAEIKFITRDPAVIGKQTIAIFKSGEMTVADILFHYKVNPQKISYASELALRESLKNAVALYVRDWVFSEKGLAERLDRRPAVREEIRTRREYLLAQKMINRLYQEQATDGMYETELQAIVTRFTRQLREKTEIRIFEEQLMAVNTSDEGLARKIDFIAVQTQ